MFPFRARNLLPRTDSRSKDLRIRSLVRVSTQKRLISFQCLYLADPIRPRLYNIYFGENQLLPSSITVSALTTGHPSIFPHTPVRASTPFSRGFTLPMVSSPGFGSNSMHLSPVKTWFPFAYTTKSLKLAHTINSLAHFSIGTISPIPPKAEGLYQLDCARFQVLFHSSIRGSFHLSLTVLVHYRCLDVFSLSRRSCFLHSRLTCLELLWKTQEDLLFRLRGYYPLWLHFPGRFFYKRFSNFFVLRHRVSKPSKNSF